MLAAIGAAGIVIFISYMMFSRAKISYANKHVYVTGGSQGLGLSLACILASRGAHVTIVSRSQAKLDAALEQISTHRINDAQVFKAISADLIEPVASERAFDQACAAFDGKAPDMVVSCVGGASNILGFFKDLTPDQLKYALDTNYYAALWTTQAAAKKMIEQKSKGKIVLTSSVLGFFGLVGYTAYGPAKMALRGLAESLRHELKMYDISIHCYFPATILSPGYEAENACKPAITKEIEGADEGQTPEVCATKLLQGLDRNEFLITSDLIGDLFKNTMRGIAPKGNLVLDTCLGIVGSIALPIWRMITDAQMIKYGKQQGFR